MRPKRLSPLSIGDKRKIVRFSCNQWLSSSCRLAVSLRNEAIKGTTCESGHAHLILQIRIIEPGCRLNCRPGAVQVEALFHHKRHRGDSPRKDQPVAERGNGQLWAWRSLPRIDAPTFGGHHPAVSVCRNCDGCSRHCKRRNWQNGGPIAPAIRGSVDVAITRRHAEFASVGRTGNRSETPPPPFFALSPGHTRIG